MGKRNATETLEHSAATTPSTPQKRQKLQDAVHLNQSVTETPPQTYTLTKELVEDTVLLDLNLQKWRVGQPVGTYNFISQSVCLSGNYVATATYPFPIPHPVRIRWPPSRRIGLLLAFLILSLEFPSRVECGLLRLLFKYLCNFDKYPNLSFSLSGSLSLKSTLDSLGLFSGCAAALRVMTTGKGSFGEIFLASDDISRPVSDRNAKYVVKIEPHSNGPLFVEIHCLMNTAKDTGTLSNLLFCGILLKYLTSTSRRVATARRHARVHRLRVAFVSQ